MNQKSVVGRVLSLEQTVGGIVQRANPFPTATINQELPDEIKRNNKFLMELLQGGFDFSESQDRKLNQIVKDTVEIEQ